MNKLYKSIKFARKEFLAVVYITLTFNACCMFPLDFSKNIFDFTQLYIYAMIAFIFAGLYESKPLKVWNTIFIWTTIGLICRFLLEYGETSNTKNFTIQNVVTFLMIISIAVTVGYVIIQKSIKGQR